MNFNYDELRSIFIHTFSNFTGWNRKAVEELVIKPTEGVDFPDLGEIAGIEGITFLRYFADDIYIYLMCKDQSFRLLLIFGDQCLNVDDVQGYMEKYEESKYDNVFTILNDVSDPMDSLMLEANFDATSVEDAIEMLSFLFSVLSRDDFIECAYPMLRYFDRCSQNIAI